MVKIRLARRGRKKLALYDVVVANVTAPRDGRFIEKIGTYNPNTIPATIVLNEDRALNWLMNGAQPTDTTRAILSYRGVMYKKHLQVGVNKGAITQEAADEKYNAWKDGKDSKISGRVDNLAQAKVDAAKVRLEAETKVNETRVAAQKAKLAAELAAANPAPAPVEEAAPVAEVVETPAAEATPAVEETVAEVTPEVVVETPAAEVTPEPVAEAPAVEETVAEIAPEAVAEVPAAEEVADVSETTETPAEEEPKAEA